MDALRKTLCVLIMYISKIHYENHDKKHYQLLKIYTKHNEKSNALHIMQKHYVFYYNIYKIHNLFYDK